MRQHRRRYLRTACVLGVWGLAGCTDRLTGSESSNDDRATPGEVTGGETSDSGPDSSSRIEVNDIRGSVDIKRSSCSDGVEIVDHSHRLDSGDLVVDGAIRYEPGDNALISADRITVSAVLTAEKYADSSLPVERQLEAGEESPFALRLPVLPQDLPPRYTIVVDLTCQ